MFLSAQVQSGANRGVNVPIASLEVDFMALDEGQRGQIWLAFASVNQVGWHRSI